MREFVENKRAEAEKVYEAKCHNYDLEIKSAIETAARAGIRKADFHVQGSLGYGGKEILERYLRSIDCKLINAFQNYSWVCVIFEF